jgi:transaldolase
MKFFIDSASLEEIKFAVSMGVADGVTTNPTLMSREKGDPNDIYKAICNIVRGPVCVEAVGLETEEIVRESIELAKIAKNIVIKIPATKSGLLAVNQLEKEGIRTNVTLVFSPMQALLAAKAGASFVCPFVGRLDDSSVNGMELIEQIIMIYQNYQIKTEIIVASIRSVMHVRDSALMGAHIATVPLKVIDQLIQHPLTNQGIEKFLKDWEKINNK